VAQLSRVWIPDWYLLIYQGDTATIGGRTGLS
jgi:hypothetical protein